jgi:16S rRNA processing protein RimM
LLVEILNGEYSKFDVEECSFYKDKMILKIKGCDSADDVSQFIGKNLFITREELPPLDDNEFYWRDVFEMEVFTEEKEYLGKISEILTTGANDVLVVTKDQSEILIPATREVIKEIDYTQNKMTIMMLDGLR